jgi:hypothetical protein
MYVCMYGNVTGDGRLVVIVDGAPVLGVVWRGNVRGHVYCTPAAHPTPTAWYSVGVYV